MTQVVDLASLGHLDNHTDKGRATLLIMASIGRDKPKGHVERGVYYGGWELLSRCLGYKTFTPAAQRAVARAVAELLDAGLIMPCGKHGPNRRQAYRLTLPSVFPTNT